MGENNNKEGSGETFLKYLFFTILFLLHFKVVRLLSTLQHKHPTETLTENEEL